MSDLYQTDFALWSARQAETLRSAARERSNAGVDWEHVAEEIESLGASERRSLASHVRTVIEHLMKLHASPADYPRDSWRSTIRRVRTDIEDIIEASPSLRRELPDIISHEEARARRLVMDDMADRGEDTSGLDALTFDADHVLGPWLP
ncbi:MAG: DUF29 domain-containing protein [Acetobacteraceae bacterium]